MTRYNVGYMNQQWSNFFIILAERFSRGVAEFIRTSYDEGYRRAGFSCKLIILTDEQLPENVRYSTDLH